MEVLVGNSDSWARREVHTGRDTYFLYLQESRGSKNNGVEELLSVAVLNLGGQPVVQAAVTEFFPEVCIGGEVIYAKTGEPATASLGVQLDFDQSKILYPTKRLSKNYGKNPDGVVGEGDRDRIIFPQHWTELGEKVVFEVDVRTKDGEWVCRNLTFPARMTVDMLEKAVIKKLPGTAEI